MSGAPGPIAAGERVVLRPLVRGDAAPLERFLRVPEVRAALQLSPGVPGGEAALAAALVAGTADGLLCGIAARADGRLLGLCGLYVRSPAGRQAELGIFIGEPSDWGRGYGTEATRLLVGVGFRVLGLERIRLEVREEHAAAIRAYERAGFRRDRPGPDRGPAGRGRPLASMSVLRSEWPRAGAPA